LGYFYNSRTNFGAILGRRTAKIFFRIPFPNFESFTSTSSNSKRERRREKKKETEKEEEEEGVWKRMHEHLTLMAALGVDANGRHHYGLHLTWLS